MLIQQSELVVPANRQRREFDPEALGELATSIETKGLMHALVVREEAGKWLLVAGERRLKAITEYLWPLGGTFHHDGQPVPEGQFPCVRLSDLDPLSYEEAELEENTKRKDLTWAERASAVARLNDLRAKQALRQDLPAPTVASLSLETKGSSEGAHYDTTRKELIVAKHLDNPEVAGAKTLQDAFKALKRSEEAKKNVLLAETVGRTFTADLHQIHNTDSLIWMKEQPSESFDVIITDPPYGMAADEFGSAGGKATSAHNYKDDEATFIACHHSLAFDGYRLAKPQAHLYCFCDIDKLQQLRELFASAGWWVHRTPIIWHKPAANRIPWPEHGPQRKWEMLLYAVKGKKPVTHTFPDLVSINADPNLGMSAQKPVGLYVDLLKRSVKPGDAVLDPFCGTGPVFEACHELKTRAYGVEIDQGSYGIALKRIERIKMQQELGL